MRNNESTLPVIFTQINMGLSSQCKILDRMNIDIETTQCSHFTNNSYVQLIINLLHYKIGSLYITIIWQLSHSRH